MRARPCPTLVLAGRLEAVPLGDMLQVLAAARRDGVLTVERDDPPQWGEIELAGGRVVRAEVSDLPAQVGGALLRHRAIDPDVLGEALRRQSAAQRWKTLGAVLLEMGAVDRTALTEALLDQIGAHAGVMLTWTEGVFRFRSLVGPAAGSGVCSGLDPREVLFNAARLHDEMSRAH